MASKTLYYGSRRRTFQFLFLISSANVGAFKIPINDTVNKFQFLIPIFIFGMCVILGFSCYLIKRGGQAVS